METKIKTKSFTKKNINISNKEKNLLIILSFVVFLWVINKFALTSQSAKIAELEQEKASYEAQLVKLDSILVKDKPITEQWIGLNRDIRDIRTKYFSDIDQPKIMYTLNEIIDNNDLYISTLNFSGPENAAINDIETKYLGISIPFEGSYNDLVSFFSRLRNSPKKFLVTQLSLGKNERDLLSGQIALNVYSYAEDLKGYTDYVYKPEFQSVIKENPFKSFEGYTENVAEDVETSYDIMGNLIINDRSNKTILENFEGTDNYFMASSSNVTGKVSQFKTSKFGNYSSRMEYFISTDSDDERAYIALDDKNIVLKYPPSSIGIWTHSYAYSPATVGLRFKDQEGENIDLELARGVNWIGWDYIEALPPQDINIYPLKLDRIYLQLGANRDDYGVILFDNLEAYYPIMVNEIKEDKGYTFYIVQYGDTIESISEKIYGTKLKYKAIMNQNGLNNGALEVGQILVISK